MALPWCIVLCGIYIKLVEPFLSNHSHIMALFRGSGHDSVASVLDSVAMSLKSTGSRQYLVAARCSFSALWATKTIYLPEAALPQVLTGTYQHFLSQTAERPSRAFASHVYVFNVHQEQIAPYKPNACSVGKGTGRTLRMPTITVFIWLDVLMS